VSLADDLAALLDARPERDGARVEAWRFELAEGEALRAGMKGGTFGGPYEPPALLAGVGGWVDVRWSDGMTTLASLDRLAADALADRPGAWRAVAFRDRWPAPIPEPLPCPPVPTADPRIEESMLGDPAPFFETLGRARRVLSAHGSGQIDASVGAGRGRRWILNSAGLRVEYPETSYTLNVSADELYWETYAKRRLPTAEEAEALFERVARTTAQLRRDDTLPYADVPVLLVPSVFEAFVGRFLGANLNGRTVVNGHSAFTLDDFREGRPIVREDVDLFVDSTLPLEMAASPCSGDGVPGGRAALIRAGRLVTPTLDLKHAHRVELPPTPSPRGQPTLLLEPAAPAVDVESALAGLPAGLIVHFVMGLHTQDATRGEYSVVAPQAQVVRGGVTGGRVKVRLAGDFLAQLRDTGAAFVRFPNGHNPGLMARCDVVLEGA
jgi:PmbA protein